jgi:hypothetical protein
MATTSRPVSLALAHPAEHCKSAHRHRSQSLHLRPNPSVETRSRTKLFASFTHMSNYYVCTYKYLVRNFASESLELLLTNAHLATLQNNDCLGLIPNGIVAIEGKTIKWVGKANDPPKRYQNLWCTTKADGLSRPLLRHIMRPKKPCCKTP